MTTVSIDFAINWAGGYGSGPSLSSEWQHVIPSPAIVHFLSLCSSLLSVQNSQLFAQIRFTNVSLFSTPLCHYSGINR